MAQLAPGTAAALGERLSKDASLKLPASMQGAAAEAVPDPRTVEQYLRNLLERDAGVFLERYGDKLSSEERGLFQALRVDSYEVNFHLSALEAAERRHTPAGRSMAVTNRRWAALQRLEQGGEHFAEEAMRRRAPLLFQLYFGERAAGAAAGAGSAGGGKLSDLLLRQHDEALTRERLAREQAREAEVEQESDSEEEEAAEGRSGCVGSGGDDDEGGGEGCGGAARPRFAGREEALVGAAPAAQSAARNLRAEGPDTQGAVDSSSLGEHASGGHGGGGGSSVGGSGVGSARAGTGAAEGGDGGGSGAGAGGERAGRSATAAVDKEEFLELMRARFLAGLDDDVDYAAIDADRSLDEDLWALAEQDALDRYFDGD